MCIFIANIFFLLLTGYSYVQKINVTLDENEIDVDAIKSNVNIYLFINRSSKEFALQH